MFNLTEQFINQYAKNQIDNLINSHCNIYGFTREYGYEMHHAFNLDYVENSEQTIVTNLKNNRFVTFTWNDDIWYINYHGPGSVISTDKISHWDLVMQPKPTITIKIVAFLNQINSF